MVTNAAAYRFTPLQDLKELRHQLLGLGRQGGLKGTILLAPEGINLFVAGDATAIDRLLEALPLERSQVKFSQSQTQPFSRMLVRLKKEIIAFGQPTTHIAPRLSPQELKCWLDEGRPLTLLDTRNDYEVRMGTFRGAVDLNLSHFRDFPLAAEGIPKDLPVVTFCTGGIRCEKAAPWLEDQGFAEVYQLDGGILRYFEEVGGDHYQGECFVFDRRVGVDPALEETESTVCPVCLAPLCVEEQSDFRYLRGKSCPHCHRDQDEIALRQEALRRVTTPLPGSLPAENRRPLRIPRRCHGLELIQALDELFPEVTDWTDLQDPRGQPAEPLVIVHEGEQYQRVTRAEVEPAVSADVEILYIDESLVLLKKPAPLPMHPCGRFHRNTLRHFLELAFASESPRPAHRLDADTTGLLVCARTHHFARLLQQQFATGQVQKWYQALVHGHPEQDRFEVDDSIRDLAAHTLFEVLERRADGTALLLARPVSGRTNQIRTHLRSLGHPVVGDRSSAGEVRTLTPADPPLHLHSWKMALRHPLTGQPFAYECPVRWGR